jgi:hypothetical protein
MAWWTPSGHPPATRKRFDVLVEGLDLSKSRGDSTPVELFVRSCVEIGDSEFRRLIGTSWPKPAVTTMRSDK